MKIIKNLSTSLDKYDDRKDISYLLNIKMRFNRGKVDMDVLRWFLRLFRDDVLLKLETHSMKDFLYVMHRIFDTNIREMKFSHFIEMFSETKKQRELLYSYAVNFCASLKETRLRNILNHVDVEKFSNYRLYLDIIESFLIKVKKSLYKIELGLVKKNKKEDDIPEKEDSNDKKSGEKIEKEDQMQIHKITENSYVTDMSNYENDFRESSSEKIYINKNCDEYKNLERKEKAREFAKNKNTSQLPTDQKFAKDKKEEQLSMDRKFEDIVRNSKFLNEKKNEEYGKKQSFTNLENITGGENSKNNFQETFTIRKQDDFQDPEQSIDKKFFKKNKNQKIISKNANVAGNPAVKSKSATEHENLGQNYVKQKTFLDEKYEEYMKDNGKQKTFLDEKYEEYLKSKEEKQIAKSKNNKEHTKAYVNSTDKTSKPSRSSPTKIFSSSTNNIAKDEKTMNEEDLIEEDFIEELRNFDLEGFIKKKIELKEKIYLKN
ncbi:hypothetical protein GVAV_000345 [Gurleya vavrai]